MNADAIDLELAQERFENIDEEGSADEDDDFNGDGEQLSLF